MDIFIQLINLFVFLGFIITGILFTSIIRRSLLIVPAFLFSVIVYIITTNGLFAGIALLSSVLILHLSVKA